MSKPKGGNTPLWSFRIPPELRASALATARERGETVTAVVVKALREYVAPPNSSRKLKP